MLPESFFWLTYFKHLQSLKTTNITGNLVVALINHFYENLTKSLDTEKNWKCQIQIQDLGELRGGGDCSVWPLRIMTNLWLAWWRTFGWQSVSNWPKHVVMIQCKQSEAAQLSLSWICRSLVSFYSTLLSLRRLNSCPRKKPNLYRTKSDEM